MEHEIKYCAKCMREGKVQIAHKSEDFLGVMYWDCPIHKMFGKGLEVVSLDQIHDFIEKETTIITELKKQLGLKHYTRVKVY